VGGAGYDPVSVRVGVLLTDIVGSTALWQHHATVMPTALLRHHDLVAAAVRAHGGRLPPDQGEGDSRLAVFEGDRALDAAISAALALRDLLDTERWPDGMRITVRAGIDEGDVLVHEGNVFGAVVNRCSRVRGLAGRGQILVRHDEPVAGGATWTDLGLHALRDVEGLHRLWQVDAAGAVRSFASLPVAEVARAPRIPDGFVGRDEEVSRVRARIGPRRVITLSGPGGTGKTAIALAVAHRVAPELPGGAAFVDLAAVRTSADVATRVALALGVNDDTGDAWAAVRDATLGRTGLVVLDNCEQIAGLGALLDDVIDRLPDVAWLTTSRVAIGVNRENVVAISPLRVADLPASDEATLTQSPAGHLLLDRARESGAVLDGGQDMFAELAEITRLLDGHPLALELTAARLRLQSTSAVLASLKADGDRGVLDVTGRMPERQRSLSDVIDWSLDRLSDAGRSLVDALAAFEGAAGTEPIARVAGLADLTALTALSESLDSGLVRAVGSDGRPRFDLLVPVRQHVRASWSQGRRDELHRRHTDHVAAWVDWSSRERHNAREDAAWVAECAQARSDLLAVFDRLQSEDAERACRMACCLMVLWDECHEQERGIAALLAAADSPGAAPYPLLARVLLLLLEPVRRAAGLDEVSREVADSGIPEIRALVAWLRAEQLLSAGQLDGASALLREAAELAAEVVAEQQHGVLPLCGTTRGTNLLFMARALLAETERYRAPTAFLDLAERGAQESGGPDDFRFAFFTTALVRAHVDQGHLVEASRIIDLYADAVDDLRVARGAPCPAGRASR
jgi:predicted ATPase